MISRGKKFEKQFEQDWRISFPKGVIIRLPDQQSGYFGTSQNWSFSNFPYVILNIYWTFTEFKFYYSLKYKPLKLSKKRL